MVSRLLVEAAYRNPLERSLGDFLHTNGIAFDYEREKLPVAIPARTAKYLPDFFIPGTNIILEFKGSFGGPKNHNDKSAEYRQKMVLFKEQHPDVDLRFVFQNPNSKIYKGSKTTYSKWADDHGFLWCKGPKKGSTNEIVIPPEWVAEILEQQGSSNDRSRKRSQSASSHAQGSRSNVRRKGSGQRVGSLPRRKGRGSGSPPPARGRVQSKRHQAPRSVR